MVTRGHAAFDMQGHNKRLVCETSGCARGHAAKGTTKAAAGRANLGRRQALRGVSGGDR